MRIIGIIPSRYQSTRFPGKALVDINGKSMVQRVFEQSSKAESLSKVVVATDDNRIYEHVLAFGGEVVMTSTDCKNGTERCYDAIRQMKEDCDAVINIQGDEPFIDPNQINQLSALFTEETQIGTLVKRISDTKELNSNNVNKVVLSRNHEALYFSRTPIPFFRTLEKEEWVNNYTYFKHIGIYGYRSDILGEIVKLEPSPLELAESLEQLRWLENGYRIKVGITETDSIGIDTPEDLEKALQTFSE